MASPDAVTLSDFDTPARPLIVQDVLYASQSGRDVALPVQYVYNLLSSTLTAKTALAAPTGASLIGTADGLTLANLLEANIVHVAGTLTDLRAVDPSEFTIVFIQGSASIGDGGAALYRYDPADTSSTDDGKLVVTALTTGRWKYIPNAHYELAASTGAALVGTAGGTLDVVLKSQINRVVTSIAALKALDSTKYMSSFVTGYYAQGDGGGGAYHLDTTDTSSADNGGTIIVAADNARWKLSPQLTLSARQFGAKGDGATDDTASINSIKTYCESQKLPWRTGAGTFCYAGTFTLYQSTIIHGEGSEYSTLKLTGVGTVQSARTGVVDSVDVRDVKILQGGTGTIGLDIGTLRRSLLENVYVQGFPIGVSLDIGVASVANYWNRLINVTSDCTGQAASGSVGFVLGNNVQTTYPDTDYNVLIGCKSFSCETAIHAVNAIGCKVIGHQATSVTNALLLDSGNNNEFQITAENCTNMGTAGANTLANKLDLYNDGALATVFVDNGWNYYVGQSLGGQVLSNPAKRLDHIIEDRINSAEVSASTPLFSLSLATFEGAARVSVLTTGYTQSTLDCGGDKEWVIFKRGGGTPVITQKNLVGEDLISVNATADGTVTFSVVSNGSNLSVFNTLVEIKAIGTPQSGPYMSLIPYKRLV